MGKVRTSEMHSYLIVRSIKQMDELQEAKGFIEKYFPEEEYDLRDAINTLNKGEGECIRSLIQHLQETRK